MGYMDDPLIALAGLLCHMNIQKSIEIYLDWKQSHTIVAYDRYKIRLSHFMHFIGYNYPLNQIKGDDIVAYHKTMEGKYSPATIAYSARILRNFFWFWHGRGKVHFNPKEIIPVRFINADKDMVTQSDFEDMNLVLEEGFYADLIKKLVLHLLWDTGMRVSELLELNLSSISEQGSDGLRTAKVRSRKSMRYNLVVWGKQTNRLLNNYLGLRLCIATQSDVLLINPKTKRAYTAKSIQRWIKAICHLASINKNITPHSFRHGKANYILDQGGSVRDVSAILRHVKPESSFHYMQLSTKRYQETARKYLQTV